VAVDLSLPMLRIVGEKADEEGLTIHRVRANLVQLDGFRDDAADYCICMFSTLGMIRSRRNRHQFLTHARRILKPGGLFVVHVHNLWHGLFDSEGRRWLLGHLPAAMLSRRVERGDKFFTYRGVPRMFLHTFTQGELTRALGKAGFRIKELIPLNATRQRPLRNRWLFGWLRANGWIAVCE
jgi:ubiquinone/menaquinone biosynthesis C-methylase UbiE